MPVVTLIIKKEYVNEEINIIGCLIFACIVLGAAQTPTPVPTGIGVWARDIIVYSANGGT